jgi:membrane protease YdiL (CAAX protease family)
MVTGTQFGPYLCPAVFPGELHFAFPWLESLHEALTWLLERTQGLADSLFLDPWNLASLLVLAPVLEEVVFRGPLYLVRGRMPAQLWWSIGTVFALAFALSHGRHGVALLPLFVLGVCGLWLIANSRRFWPVVALHWLYNFFISSLLIYHSLMLGD